MVKNGQIGVVGRTLDMGKKALKSPFLKKIREWG